MRAKYPQLAMPSQGHGRSTRALKRLRSGFYHAYVIKLISPLPVSKHNPSLVKTNGNQNKASETNRYHSENSCKAIHAPKSETKPSVIKSIKAIEQAVCQKHDYATDN